MSKLSERLNEVAKDKGMTQADVAKLSGLSTAVVSQIFSGKTPNPTIGKVIKIAQALEVSMDYLIQDYLEE